MKTILYLTPLLLLNCTEATLDPSSGSSQNLTDSVITYTSHIKTIMDRYCTSCHSGAAARAGLRLTTYQQVRTNSSRSNARMNNASNPMPPSGLISKAERDQFTKWIEDALPE